MSVLYRQHERNGEVLWYRAGLEDAHERYGLCRSCLNRQGCESKERAIDLGVEFSTVVSITECAAFKEDPRTLYR